MSKLAKVFVVLAAIECLGIMVLEMFLWEKAGNRINPEMTAQFLSQTLSMAANQGLYNGFLGVGIIFGLIRKNKEMVLFLLGCIIVAAIFGAISVNPGIIIKQGSLPILAFLFTIIWGGKYGDN